MCVEGGGGVGWLFIYSSCNLCFLTLDNPKNRNKVSKIHDTSTHKPEFQFCRANDNKFSYLF